MEQFLNQVFNNIIYLINHLGLWGLYAGMVLESACFPMPSELMLPLGGFMVASGRLSLLSANVAVSAGAVLGSLIAYSVGRYGGRPFLIKYGKYVFFNESKLLKTEKLFSVYGSSAVFIARLLPLARTFISIPAGMTKMNPLKFTLFSAVGIIPWNFTLVFLGYKFGSNYDALIAPLFKKFEYIIAGIFVIIVAGAFIFRSFRKRRSDAGI